MKRFLLFLLLLTPLPIMAQGTVTAASCNYSDVNAIINGPTHTVVNGDTIVIPACVGGVTWTSVLTPPAGIGFTLTGTGTANSSASTYGAGTLQTLIIDNAGNSLPMINIQGLTTSSSLMRVSLLQIEPPSPAGTLVVSPINISGTCSSTDCPHFRIDNIGYGLTTPWREANVGILGDALNRTDNVFGVLDHNTNPTGNYSEFVSTNQSAYLGVGGFGDNSWATPDSTGTLKAVFVENNILHNQNTVTETEFGAYGGGIGGSRQVGRFNQITTEAGFVPFSGHGLESDGRPRGMRQVEAYNNTVTCSTPGQCNTAIASYRSGGTGYVFNNNVSASSVSYSSVFLMNVYRTVSNFSPWGTCDGSAPWDTNDGIVYFSGTVTAALGPTGAYNGEQLTLQDTTQSWTGGQFTPFGAPYSVHDITGGWGGEIASNTNNTITVSDTIAPFVPYGFQVGDQYQVLRATVCGDQAGRGQGNLISGLTPTPSAAFSEALAPVYEWNDTVTGTPFVGTSSTARIVANRDWYQEALNQTAQTSTTAPFDGNTGTGHGTLANRPSSCNVGTAYWATDQGSWNGSGLSCTGTGVGQGCQGQLYKCTSTNTWSLAYTPAPYPHPFISGGTGVNLTVGVSPTSSGTISGTNCLTANYASGTTIGPCTATAASGFAFASWSNCPSPSGATCASFSLTTGTVLTANFSPIGQAATPTFSPTGGTYYPSQTVSISSTTTGSTICYTSDGSTPTGNGAGTCTHGTTYSGAIIVSTTQTLKAIATESGFTDSAVGSASYVITPTAATPTFSPSGGTRPYGSNVTISTASVGCAPSIYWSLTNPPNNTNPNQTSFTLIGSTTFYAKVIGCSGFTDSAIGQATFTVQVLAPTFSPVAGSYNSTQSVVITTSPSASTICYTLDGSTPTANGAGTCTHGATYTGAVTVSSPKTINAIGSDSGYADSPLSGGVFNVNVPAPSGVSIIVLQ